MFLRNIFEALNRTGQGKTAVVGWGRGMGHKGHMMLASSVITQSDKVSGDPYFVVSRTVGKDDPITPDEKIAIYKKVFPQSGHIFQPATDEIPDLTRVLQNLNQQGYTSVTVVLGADQVKAFQYLKNYNNKPDKSGNILYSFDNLDVISRQETGDPSAGEEGPRATPMRQVLMDPTKSEQEQFAVWRDAMSPEIGDDEVRDLMTKAKERMSAMSAPKSKKPKVAEVSNSALTNVAKRLTDPNDGKTAKLRAAGDKKRDNQYMSTQLAKNDRTSKDEWGNLKELSSEKLGQYKKAAGAQASAADKVGDTKKADKRFSGIVKATKKQFANDEKGVAEAVWSHKPEDIEKIHTWQNSNTGTDSRMFQGYKMKFTDDELLIYKGGDLVYKQTGDFSNPTNKDIMLAKGKISQLIYKKQGVAEGLTTEKQILTRIRQIMYDRKLSGTESNAGELLRLKQQLKDLRSQQGVGEAKKKSRNKTSLSRYFFPGYGYYGYGGSNDSGEGGSDGGGEDAAEGLGSKLAGLGLAGAMALGTGGANARVTPDGQGGYTGGFKPSATQQAPNTAPSKAEVPTGFNKEYLQKAADPNRTGRYMISVEKAQELLMKMNAVDEAKKKGADGKACWKGYRYAGTENGKDKCVPVSEDVENIMGALIENILRK